MRTYVFTALAVASLACSQCSSGSDGDDVGSSGAPGGGHSGAAGVAGAGSGGKTSGRAGAEQQAGEGGIRDSQGGQAGSPEAGEAGAPQAGASSASAGEGGASAGTHSGGNANGGRGGDTGGVGGNAAGGSGGGGSPLPPIARFGQLRIVNLAPNSVALDVCVKRTSVVAYPATPALRSAGVAGGVPFGSQSKYIDVAFTAPPDTYDFVFVAGSSTTCNPPLLGAVGSLSLSADTSTTIAIFQSYFPSSGNFSAAIFGDQWGQLPSTANARAYYAANVLSPAVDIHALRSGSNDEAWFSNLHPGSSTAFHSGVVATYEFRATNTGSATVLAQKTGVGLASDDPVDLFVYPSDGSHHALAVCSSNPSASVVACDR